MTQVPYDDIRRAVDERWLRAKELADALRTDYYDGLVDFDADELRDEAADQLLAMREALLADAERWRMIAEPSEEVVEAVARAIDRFQRGDDFLWRTEVDTARAVLRTLKGLVK